MGKPTVARSPELFASCYARIGLSTRLGSVVSHEIEPVRPGGTSIRHGAARAGRIEDAVVDRTRPNVHEAQPVTLSVVPPGHPAGRAIDGPGEELDVRLHAPTPDAVIVWVAGPLDRFTAPQLALRAGQQLHRAPHVILDLSSVTRLDPHALAVLLTLRDQAGDCGTQLHIAGVDHSTLPASLRDVGLDQQLSTGPAAAVLAALATGTTARRAPTRVPPGFPTPADRSRRSEPRQVRR